MNRKLTVTAVFIAVLVLAGVEDAAVGRQPGGTEAQIFFPLEPNVEWTYRIDSKDQEVNYQLVDKVIGQRFVEKLNRLCYVVNETYDLQSGGILPVIYYSKDGFLNRISGLEYVGQRIEFPNLTLSVEKQFLPANLMANQSWKNTVRPFGKMPGALSISQSHKVFAEKKEVVVPAGHYIGCLRVETQALFESSAHKKPSSLLYLDWYAPHVGLVRTLAMDGGLNGKIVEDVELLKFEAPRSNPSETPHNPN
jgi:hypothetical protein